MSEQKKLENSKKITKICLVTVTVLFLTVMLVVPLVSVLASALKEGFSFYIKAITTEYVLSAFKVTLIATVIAVVVNTFFGIWAAWLLTRFSFKGKQILATIIDIPFSISPVIVGLAYLMTLATWAGCIRQSGHSMNSLKQTFESHLQFQVWCLPQYL